MTPILPAHVTTDPEVVDARLAVLPVGSFEQHGSHLPLVTDTLIAVAIANAISDRYGALQLPPVTFSCSHETPTSPGRSASAPLPWRPSSPTSPSHSTGRGSGGS